VSTYRLELEKPRSETIGVIELTPSGRECRDYTLDRALPGLRVAAEPSSVADLLPGSRPAVAGGRAGCRVDVAGYHPGERAVLRYQFGDETPRRVLFGKVLSDGAAVLAANLAGLGSAAREDTEMPAVPPLVRVVDELGLVLQEQVTGEPLHAWVTDGTRPQRPRQDAFRLAGAALARLHGAGPPVSSIVTSGLDAADLRGYLPCLRQADEALAGRVETLARRASEAALAEGPDDGHLVPSHGALRTDQILLARGRPVLLDLDGYCRSLPARDIGNLFAYLRWRSIRNPSDRSVVEHARAAFIDGYATHAPRPAESDVALFEALSLLKIAGRRFRSLAIGEWPLVPSLVDAADDLLASAVGR
jgi:hypothetical protein